MKKFIIITLSIFFLAGCGSPQETAPQDIQPPNLDQSQSQPENPSQIEANPEEEQYLKDIQADKELYETRDNSTIQLSDCSDFNDDLARSNCQDEYYFDEAMEKLNSSICDKITNEEFKETCTRELESLEISTT